MNRIDPNPSLECQKKVASTAFQAQFGTTPSLWVAAPGRVNLIGEHIDYCDGLVLPLAIERYVVIAAAPHDHEEITVSSAGQEIAILSARQPQIPGTPAWANYLRGVINGFQKKGISLPGFRASIVSSVPAGAGLSSSAALELAFATLLESLSGKTLPTSEKALLCQVAETDFAGCPCGIMDQFASAFGEPDRLVLIDCQSQATRLIPFLDPELAILISNTRVSHQLTDGAYAERRQQTEQALATLGATSWRNVSADQVTNAWEKLGSPVNQRARHVVSEISRTIAAASAFEKQDYEEVGRLMSASHHSLRDDFQVSCQELDLLVTLSENIGLKGGIYGSRMTGGGFGGSTVTLCQQSAAQDIAEKLTAGYLAEAGREPEIFLTRPAQGATLLS